MTKQILGIVLTVVAVLVGTAAAAQAEETDLPPICHEVPLQPFVQESCDGILKAQAEIARLSEPPSTAVPLDFPILRRALAIAEQYWASRGIALPPLGGVYELPAEERFTGDAAFSDLPGNRIWLAGWELEALGERSILRQFNIRTRAEFCYIVIHERGHNAGLHHSDADVFPIMAIPDEIGLGWVRQEVAPRCWAWAKHPFYY